LNMKRVMDGAVATADGTCNHTADQSEVRICFVCMLRAECAESQC